MEIRRYANGRVDWAALDALRILQRTTVTPDYRTLPLGVGLTASYYDDLRSRRLKASVGIPSSNTTSRPELRHWTSRRLTSQSRFEGKIRFKYTETYTLYLTHNDSGKLWMHTLTAAAS
jgi:hypothetical protein